MPVVCGKKAEGRPSMHTWKVGCEYSARIAVRSFRGMPARRSASVRAVRVTLSKAFSQSRRTNIVLLTVLSPESINILMMCMACAVLCARLKPNCVGGNRDSTPSAVRVCSICAHSFIIVFSSEMGR